MRRSRVSPRTGGGGARTAGTTTGRLGLGDAKVEALSLVLDAGELRESPEVPVASRSARPGLTAGATLRLWLETGLKVPIETAADAIALAGGSLGATASRGRGAAEDARLAGAPA